jgi:predicted RND superfamily exporter protein
LGAELSKLEKLDKVEYKIGAMTEMVSTFMPQALLFLDEDGRRSLEAKLSDSAVRTQVQELRRMVETPQALALKNLMRLDPLGLAELFLDHVTGAREGLAIDWASGYLLSRDHEMFLILAKPNRAPQDVDFSRELLGEVQGVIDELASEWPVMMGSKELEIPEVSLGGRYVMALGDDALIRRDVTVNVLTSMLGVLVLFLIAFRRFGPLIYAFLPLTCGLVLTFGFAGLTYGKLSAATSGVAALLIGLGIDFVIVSYGRFVEERQQGASLEEGLAKMSGSSGRAVVVGAVTSAATFYAFSVTEFTGLFQMGLLTGTGILFCMAAVLWLLPAMLSWNEDHHRRRARQPRLYLHGLGSARLIQAALRAPRAVLLVGLVVTLLAAWLALRLEFVDSVQEMRPAGNEGSSVRDEVAERFGVGFEQMMLVVHGDSMEEVLALATEAADGAQDLVEEGVLSGYDSVSSLIPPVPLQRENLAWLAEARLGPLDMQRIRTAFEKTALEEGLRVEPFEPGLELLSEAISRDRIVAMDDFGEVSQARSLLDRYLHETEEGWKSVVYLFPKGTMWRREAPPGAVQLAVELGPKAVLTGANVVSNFLRKTVLRDAVIAAVLGFLVVGILLWLDYRRIWDTILTLVPLLVGLVWMLGGMVLMGSNMNFMNIFVSTMIIGIGVDYGIHMIHRYRELGEGSEEELAAGFVETGKAIVLAALSTTVGFGSLSLSHYPGLQSMGKVAILGALSTALVAITLLPAYLLLRYRKRMGS